MIKDLLILAVKAPGDAATRVIGMRLDARTIWMLLALLTVVSSLISSVALYSVPDVDPRLTAMVQNMLAYRAPVIFAALQLAQAVFGVYVAYYIGRSMGGQGRPEELAICFVLVQAVALLLAIAVIALSLLLPFINSIGLLVLMIWVVYASVCVITVAHRFDRQSRAFVVLILSGFVTMLVSLSVGSVLMPTPQGTF